jgi:hypothetical protein
MAIIMIEVKDISRPSAEITCDIYKYVFKRNLVKNIDEYSTNVLHFTTDASLEGYIEYLLVEMMERASRE